jgi:protein-L-isoaspartate(D-aspartate) O-methyltransferase
MEDPVMRRLAEFAMAAILVAGTVLPAPASAAKDFVAERRQMVGDIEALVRQTRAELGKEAFDARVMDVMGTVPRHEFVPDDQRRYAYRNRPLPIGHGQTISQPYIVALMTDLARVRPGDRVLEVGTGSGYQAAVLSHLAGEVYTIEIVEPLGMQAAERLRRLGHANVQVRLGDGYHGWEAHAPYEAILVTAAASHVPPPLLRQLKPGGRMVIPVGAAFMVQQLMLVEKHEDGSLTTRQVLPVRFVPLTGNR